MKKYFKQIIFLMFLIIVLLLPYFVFADFDKTIESLKKTAVDYGGYVESGEDTLPNTIAGVIKVLLGFLGIIFVVLIIYAGFHWMTAAGNEEKITKAKSTIKNAIIGLIILVSAYAITNFVLNALLGGN